jgi:hypothetical protein
VNGNNASTVSGIQGNGAVISGNVVINLEDDADGITSASASDTVVGNRVNNLDAGDSFVWTAGTTAKGNRGYPTTASDGDSDDAITLNAETGLLTTKSLTTAAGGSYLLVLNNVLITSSSRINVTAGRGGGMSQGFPQVVDVQLISGQAYIRIMNQDLGTGLAFNGPVNLFFAVDN